MKIVSFIRQYKNDSQRRVPMLELQDLMALYMGLLDELFFFGLLTKQGRRCRNPFRKGQLVQLQVIEEADGVRWGAWEPAQDQITLHTEVIDDGRIVELNMNDMVTTLAHEMIHAYLHIFSSGTRGYDVDVALAVGADDDDTESQRTRGHGPVFWEFYQHITGKFTLWIPESQELHDGAGRAERQEL
ncbi:uncharacterized protein JN550_012195 [Neoarthrinium moseri]|uniref:uncharacterized protein n=1 Tax=Neoarthrinium moseri TaxID=1658444 RepID=UPI001FDE3467|nr:uncharacterized protein JN550_012195 [Neoarthrinium moseri]KAI1859182.1 hypothetical protein JN550_012195 [Neoarthrinium moseri]